MASPKFHPRPDEVVVGPHLYTIEWLDTDEWMGRDFDMEKGGLTFNHKYKIFIRLTPDTPESHYQETVLHEVTHAIWSTVGFNYVDGLFAEANHDVEERVILMQTPLLLHVLKENPILAKYVLSEGRETRR